MRLTNPGPKRFILSRLTFLNLKPTQIHGQDSFLTYLRNSKHNKQSRGRKRKVLVQLVHQPRIHIILSEFIPALLKHFQAIAVVVDKDIDLTFRSFVRRFLGAGSNWFCSRGVHGVYRELGCSRLSTVMPGRKTRKEAKLFAKNFLDSNPTKEDLEDLQLLGVQIGDLIYDSFLRIGHITIDFRDPGLKTLLEKAYILTIWTKRNLSQGVSAVVSDSVYLNGILSRVAIQQGIPVFCPGEQEIYRLSAAEPRPENMAPTPEHLLRLKGEARAQASRIGKKFIEDRTQGRIDPLIGYMQSSPYSSVGEISEDKDLHDGILVACHDFFDSPHVFGNAFFPDFFEWLSAIDVVSQQSKRTWIIKPHPRSSEATICAIREMFDSNSRANIVDRNTSTRDLVNRGVRFVLTVYGTIASEVPVLGVTAILATRNHAYTGLGIVPELKNRDEWLQVVRDLDKMEFTPNMENLYLFHHFQASHVLGSRFLGSFWEDFDNFCRNENVHSYSSYGDPEILKFRSELAGIRPVISEFLRSQQYRTELFSQER